MESEISSPISGVIRRNDFIVILYLTIIKIYTHQGSQHHLTIIIIISQPGRLNCFIWIPNMMESMMWCRLYLKIPLRRDSAWWFSCFCLVLFYYYSLFFVQVATPRWLISECHDFFVFFFLFWGFISIFRLRLREIDVDTIDMNHIRLFFNFYCSKICSLIIIRESMSKKVPKVTKPSYEVIAIDKRVFLFLNSWLRTIKISIR